MTEATIRSVAKEIAGEFYQFIRSAESRGEKHVQVSRGERALLNIRPDVFGKTYPTVKDYLSGRRHGRIGRTPEGSIYHIDDGSLQQDTPGWLYWYDMARQRLVEMLNRNDVTEHMKDRILEAIIEDREKELRQKPGDSPNIAQRRHLQH